MNTFKNSQGKSTLWRLHKYTSNVYHFYKLLRFKGYSSSMLQMTEMLYHMCQGKLLWLHFLFRTCVRPRTCIYVLRSCVRRQTWVHRTFSANAYHRISESLICGSDNKINKCLFTGVFSNLIKSRGRVFCIPTCCVNPTFQSSLSLNMKKCRVIKVSVYFLHFKICRWSLQNSLYFKESRKYKNLCIMLCYNS